MSRNPPLATNRDRGTRPTRAPAERPLDVVLAEQQPVGGLAERYVAVLAGHRTIGPVNSRSTRAATMPSPTPPLWRVSSTTTTPPGGIGLAQHVLDRQQHQPAQVDNAQPDALVGEQGRDPQAHPQAVAEREHCLHILGELLVVD